MVRRVTDAEISAYREHGVVKLPGFVDVRGVALLLEALDEQLANPSRWGADRGFKTDRCFALEVPVLHDYVLDPVMGENAARAMGSETARFYFDHMFAFQPDTPIDEHYWHQDQPFWPVEGEQIVSFWLSLTACTPESSALKFIPGTHHESRFFPPNGFDGNPMAFDPGQRGALAVHARDQFLDHQAPPFHEDPDAHGVVEWSYEPGDAVMFHTRTLHSSGGNSSAADRRVAYSVRYVGDDARLTLRNGVFQDPALMPDDDGSLCRDSTRDLHATSGLRKRCPLSTGDPLGAIASSQLMSAESSNDPARNREDVRGERAVHDVSAICCSRAFLASVL